MLKIIRFLFLLLVFVFSLAFTVLNTNSVQVNYHFGSWELPLALVIGITLVTGALLGVMASIGLVFKLKRQIAKLRREVERTTPNNAGDVRLVPIQDSAEGHA